MSTTDNYECTWDLFKTIPSLTSPGSSVLEATLAFNERHRSHALSRLVDRRAARVGVPSMGFSMQDRAELLKISSTDESVLGASRITDWLSPAFFETRFWVMWGIGDADHCQPKRWTYTRFMAVVSAQYPMRMATSQPK